MTPVSFLRLAWKSLSARKATALLTIMTIALSVTLFLGVDKIRRSAADSFNSTVTGTDLIVGARTGSVNLLLYSVFRIGEPTGAISGDTAERIAARPDVAWTIPLSLGDSYRGYRVLGTTEDYFEHYRYGNNRLLTLSAGRRFDHEEDVVIGATVAREEELSVGDTIVIGHGLQSASFSGHDHHPLTIVGIIAPTGTPVDRTVHVSLEALDELHTDFVQDPTARGAVTAVMVGLQNRRSAPLVAAQLSRDTTEPLTAIIPGVALTELWQVVGNVETALTALGLFVVGTGLLCLLTAIMTSLNERRREIAVLRAAGARGSHVFSLLVSEAVLLAGVGTLLGAGAVYGVLRWAGPVIEARFGIPLSGLALGAYDVAIMGLVVGAAGVVGLIPAWRAYRHSLADGLTIKL